MSFFSAIVGSIFSGLGSRSEARRERAASREERRESFNNDLRLADYQTRLVDHLSQAERQRKSRGWDTWTSGGPKPIESIGPGPNLNDYLQKDK